MMGGATRSEQDESIGFFAVLAEDDKLPEQIDPQLIDIFISTARDKRRVLAVRVNALNIVVKLLERPTSHTHTIVDKGIINVISEVIYCSSHELRAASILAARHISKCCDDCRSKLIEAGVAATIIRQMHCGSAEDVRELVAAASTLALNKPSVIAIQFSEEFEDKCKETIREEISMIGSVWNLSAPFKDRLYARDDVPTYAAVFFALVCTVNQFGLNDDEIAKTLLLILLKVRYWCYYSMWLHGNMVRFLRAVIASDKTKLAKRAINLILRLTPADFTYRIRTIIDEPGFMLHVAQWTEGEDEVAHSANNLLRRIAEQATDQYADIVLEDQALIMQLTRGQPGEWRDEGAIALLLKVLEHVTVGGPTTESEHLLGYGRQYCRIIYYKPGPRAYGALPGWMTPGYVFCWVV
ncbi:hypothetical protein PRIPAC_89092 [Pristionchus pacificus]|uniref:Uncharacterized protein n=1 Tax=Pristionchus pacificus TaxID=54126 RepID=A0A2A6CVH9_PRIPA|nr:hypothetical protein PRIPAC_89092 [Pristionchus pacificus]|eukprot:PDM82031.1 hypothetical protein PRIPAC_36424 [Pristionchus pacificus]